MIEGRRLGRDGLTAERLLDEIYTELFRRARPPADFHAMLKSGEAKRPDFFMHYYMNDNMQVEVIDRVCSFHRLGRDERKGVTTAVMLGCAPNGNHSSWLELRGKLAKEGKRWRRFPNPDRDKTRARYAVKKKRVL